MKTSSSFSAQETKKQGQDDDLVALENVCAKSLLFTLYGSSCSVETVKPLLVLLFFSSERRRGQKRLPPTDYRQCVGDFCFLLNFKTNTFDFQYLLFVSQKHLKH